VARAELVTAQVMLVLLLLLLPLVVLVLVLVLLVPLLGWRSLAKQRESELRALQAQLDALKQREVTLVLELLILTPSSVRRWSLLRTRAAPGASRCGPPHPRRSRRRPTCQSTRSPYSSAA